MISTRTTFHICLESSLINNTAFVPRSICNKKHTLKAVQRQPIFDYDVDHDYILQNIERHDYIEYRRKIHNDDK